MPTDEQYGRQIGVLLRHETDDVNAAPDLVRTLRRRRARRAWAMRAAVAAPLAAVTAAGIALATGGPDVPGGGRQAGGATHTTDGRADRLTNVAHVQAQTVDALSRAAGYVIHAKTTYDTGYYEHWTDKATRRYRIDAYTNVIHPDVPDGQAPPPPSEWETGPMRLSSSLSVSGPEGNQTSVTVDYDHRTWSRARVRDRDRSRGMPASEVPDITDAAEVRWAMTEGRLELVGRETVDGIDTLHLRIHAGRRGYLIDMWVDSTSYLPVQETAAAQGSVRLTTRYSWLPRTGENLARLVLTPPPGFRRLK